MEDNNHPADELINTFHDFINGKGFVQSIRDAYDRIKGNVTPQSDHDAAVQQMNDQANAQTRQDAMKTFIKPDVAAKIRAKAAK